MKAKKKSRKLVLNRSTITNLDSAQLNAVKGGTDRTWLWSRCICPDSYSACECTPTD